MTRPPSPSSSFGSKTTCEHCNPIQVPSYSARTQDTSPESPSKAAAMASSEKVSLYNLADLKNTSDDAIPNYLNSLKFRQSTFLTDVRLALGYGAFAVGAACFLWDYKLGFESTKQYTAIAVALYTLLNGALTYWLSEVEKGIVYQGAAPSGEKITISSSTQKNDPTYRLSVVVEPKGAEPEVIEVAKPFITFFDETGRFVAAPFQEALASSVPTIGRADPKRVKLASQALLEENPGLLDAVLAANAEGSSTAAEAAEKKDGKRRKA
ncbi:Signal peptidase complex subunit SPC2 [Tolypocladium capitatum]|uniref:Signal peptidase complex subunit 2 n=1 Tax=Tolypocladium capitatum TaxID=45235 RepID=A0A2K3QNU9_9HYPO|nr:Signal peptidase complex subunit SPC2 [Tolypocladium capitatum]